MISGIGMKILSGRIGKMDILLGDPELSCNSQILRYRGFQQAAPTLGLQLKVPSKPTPFNSQDVLLLLAVEPRLFWMLTPSH